MDGKTRLTVSGGMRYESDFVRNRNTAETLDFSRFPLGQNDPQHCPHRPESVIASEIPALPLGEPLAIGEVAALLGCSAWTVRQRYLRQGLPYLQARPHGKLVFFREQVIGWIQQRQRQKGGFSR